MTTEIVPAHSATDWRQLLVVDPAELAGLIRSCHRIAVLGIKTEAQRGQPAFEVPRYMLDNGYEIVPVPVYFPEVEQILGRPVFRRLADVPGPIDMVNVFRRSEDVPAHVADLLAARPRAVWLQSGIRHAGVAETLARAGIKVVQDRCLMVDHARLARSLG
jgi:hypothetical protein